MDLLTKARKINYLLQKGSSNSVSFMAMSKVLSSVILADVYVISRRGKILGACFMNVLDGNIQNILNAEILPLSKEENDWLMLFSETSSNLEKNTNILKTIEVNNYTTVVPIVGGGKRLGTLVLTRCNPFIDDDLILSEYGSTVVGMEILREKAEQAEEEARNKMIVKMALDSLSYSELEALEYIFDEVEGKETLLVASRVADKVGITRSVIVNALRKLECAGVIESRSLGMKGTYIKVLNDDLFCVLEHTTKN